MSLDDDFRAAGRRAASLPAQPNDVLLELYGLYKQATVGDISGDRPGIFDLKGVAKHDAWESRRGMSKEAAMQAYIELVDRLDES